MKKLFLKILIAFVIFFSIVILFKDYFLYKNTNILTVPINESTLVGYTKSNNYYLQSSDEENYINILDINEGINNIEIYFDEGLSCDSKISLYLYDSEGKANLIDEKEVHSGLNEIKFSFSGRYVTGIKITINSIKTNVLTEISKGNLNLNCKRFAIFNLDCLKIILYIVVALFSIIFSNNLVNKSYNNENKAKTRDSNIELLRIILMILIVAHHYSVHGGLIYSNNGFLKCFGLLFLPIGKICFVCYIAISMYYLADSENKKSRFLKCWLEVLFYSVALAIISYIMGDAISIREFVGLFFVMTGNSHDFAANYLLFLLIYPFILNISKKCNKSQLGFLTILLFIIQIWSQIINKVINYTQPIYSEFLLFIFCYFLSCYLKKYQPRILNEKLTCFIVFIFVWIYTFFLNVLAWTNQLNGTTQLLYSLNGNESSLIFIIGGYALFYLFLNIKINFSQLINNISSGIFGVLLIHDNNYFRHLFWNEIIQTQTLNCYSKFIFICLFAIICISIFVCCLLIDYLRRKLIEKHILKSKLYKNCQQALDKVSWPEQ